MIGNHNRILAVMPSLLPLVVGCANSIVDEPIGEASAAQQNIYLRYGTIEGESTDGRTGTLWSWAPADDGSGKAQVVTDCEGALCRLVSVDAVLVSSTHTLEQGPTVWTLSALGSDAQPWSAKLVTRRPPQDPLTLETKGIDVTDLSVGGAPQRKPSWSTMAPGSFVDCVVPDCGVEFLEEGWTCLPVCTLSKLGK
jgi:hypothetical protein